MINEKEYRKWLSKYTKEQLIDLYIQKAFEQYMTTKYGEGGMAENNITNPDGTIPFENHNHCQNCYIKDSWEVASLELRKRQEELMKAYFYMEDLEKGLAYYSTNDLIKIQEKHKDKGEKLL